MIQKFKSTWDSHAWMRVRKEVDMPSWFTAEYLEDGSCPILKDLAVLEMLDMFAERYPAFNKTTALHYLKKLLRIRIT